MPATQPEGAIRTLAGSFVDAIFSNDGLRFFTVSGNTVTVVNSADGTTVKTYTIGTQLGAIDISQNGRYLAVVEEQPGGSTGVLYRIDLTNGAIATFSIPGTSALHDVAFLADGSVVVSQENSAPLRVVTLGTSAYWIASGEIRPNATISVSADATYFIAQPPGIDWPLHGFDTETGTGYAVYYDPYAGAGVGLGGSAVGAVSPDGGMVVQGMTMRVYQSDFSSSISLSAIHPEIYNPAALAFSPDGSKLYVLVANIDKLIVLDTNNWATLASYPIGADALNPSEWSAGTITPGEMMRVSGDGNFLSIITPGGIQVINLELVIEPNYDGGAGDDTIVGSSAPDTISGAGGNDTLSGGAGNDIIKGDDGNDWLSGGLGADTLTGGSGADTFYFGPTAQSNADHITDLSAGDRIELDAALFSGLELGPLDAAAFVQGAEPSAPEHRIIYNSATGQILFDPDGNGPQNRILFATLEPGTVISAAMFEVVAKATADIESGVTYTLSEDELNLVLTGSAAINGTGNALNNEITGNDGSNQLFGLDGNDTLIGNAGNDLLDGGLGADQLFGGAGDDTYIVDPGDPFESDSFFESADEGIDTIVSARDIFFLPSNFENITLAGGVVADGNDQANILTGNAGINVLAGAGGNDHLIGNAGNDSLQGDEGDDLLDGGDGTDSAGYDRAETGVTVSLAINGPQNTGGAGIDTLISIEILGGSSHDDRLTASAAGNSLFGGSGNDLLFGSSGVDELDGGAGSDIYVIVSAADHSTAEIVDRGFDTGIDEVRFSATTASTLSMFASDSGIERIVIGTGTGPAAVTTGLLAINIDASALGYGVAIDGNNGANRLTGGSGDDDISGRAGDDQLYGGLGNDKLTGGQGTDRLHGGAGDDYYYVNDSTDYVYELTSEGIDRVIASLDYKLGSNVENLSLAGSALVGKGNDLANVLTGNDGANFLFGYGGDDTLIGGAGDDTLSGGLGNDKLTGGVGTDRLYGGAGDDLYVITEATDSVTEYAGEGSDTVQSSITYTLRVNVENLTLTGGLSIDGRGNSLDNLIGGNAGSNKIYG
ncbi:MAG TPA: hypothetical protein VFH89_16020, partial [Sphingomicrobium sp.]|nr:hypothetical protein [Sphingomicrobium sp.]